MFMRPVISLTTALAFLLHLWLGCCSHHAHADDGLTPSSPQKVTTCNHSGHCGHKHGSQKNSENEPSKECPPGGCDDAKCSFTVYGKTFESKAWFGVPMCVAILTPECNFQPVFPSHVDLGVDCDFAPPVRPHLLNQILLI